MNELIKVKQFFNQYAKEFSNIYDTNNFFQRTLNNIFRRSMKLRFEYTLQEVQPAEGKTILDIGCGPGHYPISVARVGAKSVVGIDVAENMIEIAKEKAKHYNVDNICEFLVGDFLTYDFNETFDISIIIGVMDYIANPVEFIGKVVQVTREKALYSFPRKGGLLSLRRKLVYRKRCPLFLYSRKEIENLFSNFPNTSYEIHNLGRDYFVVQKMK